MDAALNDRVCSQPMMLNMHLYYKKWSLSYHNLNLSSFPFSAKIFFFSCTFLSLYTNNKCFYIFRFLKWKSKTEMMKRTLGSPSYFFIRRRLLRQLGWLCEVRNPKQKLVHHSAQTNEDSDVQDGDDHQGDLAILEPVIPATPLLKSVGSNGVDELLAVPLLLDKPGWEEIGEKEKKNDSTNHIEYWIHDACSRLLHGWVRTEMKSRRGEAGLLPWETPLAFCDEEIVCELW